MSKSKKSVSLVLGSGGARGLAHIGVINWLNEHDYEIKSISGCSMGALVGGIYAAGKLEQYTDWVKALRKRDVVKLLDFAYSRSGLFSGDRIMQKLKSMIGSVNIEDLPISFTAVATDLDNGHEIWIQKGSLYDAIRASIAIPTIFTPVKYQGRLLVDGALTNPIPIAPTIGNLTDITIAVSLSTREEALKPTKVNLDDKATTTKPVLEYQTAIKKFIDGVMEKMNLNNSKTEEKDEINIIDIVSRSFETMQNTISRFKLAAYNPNYIIEIPVNACSIYEFYRAEEMIEFGYQRAARRLSQNSN